MADCPAGRPLAPTPLPSRATAGDRLGVRACAQAHLVALLAWVAVICAGLGSTMGTGPQTLASKLAASAQHLQRQGGPSLTHRAARYGGAAAAGELKAAKAPRAAVEPWTDRTVWVGTCGIGACPDNAVVGLAPSVPDFGPDFAPEFFPAAWPGAGTEPSQRWRHGSPQSRAPPLLA